MALPLDWESVRGMDQYERWVQIMRHQTAASRDAWGASNYAMFMMALDANARPLDALQDEFMGVGSSSLMVGGMSWVAAMYLGSRLGKSQMLREYLEGAFDEPKRFTHGWFDEPWLDVGRDRPITVALDPAHGTDRSAWVATERLGREVHVVDMGNYTPTTLTTASFDNIEIKSFGGFGLLEPSKGGWKRRAGYTRNGHQGGKFKGSKAAKRAARMAKKGKR